MSQSKAWFGTWPGSLFRREVCRCRSCLPAWASGRCQQHMCQFSFQPACGIVTYLKLHKDNASFSILSLCCCSSWVKLYIYPYFYGKRVGRVPEIQQRPPADVADAANATCPTAYCSKTRRAGHNETVTLCNQCMTAECVRPRKSQVHSETKSWRTYHWQLPKIPHTFKKALKMPSRKITN